MWPSYLTHNWKRFPRYGAYFGVAAAILIFVSWIISTTLSDRMKEAKARVSEITAADQAYKRHADLLLAHRNAEKQLTRIESRLGLPADVQINSIGQKVIDLTNRIQWTEVWGDDINDLFGFAVLLRDFSDSLPASRDLRATVGDAMTQVDALADIYETRSKDFRAKHRSIMSGDSVRVRDVTQETYLQLQSLTDSHYKETEGLVQQVYPLQNKILTLASILRGEAKQKAERFALGATISQWLAYGCYVLGTLLAIYGKALEVKKGHSTDEVDV
jgi:hypothetical protein